MNDAILSEVESLSVQNDDLSAQNGRLLEQAREREDVNKMLTTKSLQLMELKEAQHVQELAREEVAAHWPPCRRFTALQN